MLEKLEKYQCLLGTDEVMAAQVLDPRMKLNQLDDAQVASVTSYIEKLMTARKLKHNAVVPAASGGESILQRFLLGPKKNIDLPGDEKTRPKASVTKLYFQIQQNSCRAI